jgi:hypothetical protein
MPNVETFQDPDWIPRGDWQGYEAYVTGWLSTRFPGIRIEADVSVPGKKSGTARQIDVLAYGKLPIAIECKYLGRKVDVKCVEAFIGMLDDVGIRNGIIVTSMGFSKAAQRRAANDRRGIELEIVIPERHSDHQHRGTPLIWHAPIGISFGLIDGWAVDTELTDVPKGTLMMMYPLGHSRETAMHAAPVIYANFLSKPRGNETLEELASAHQADLANDDPSYVFELEQAILADRSGMPRSALVRRASGPPPIFGEEHAVYVDYGELVLLLVLCAPPGEAHLLFPKLLELYRDSFALTVVDSR